MNDPNHDRYTTSQIDTQLDIVQNRWNVDAGIIVDSISVPLTVGIGSYAVSGLTGTVVDFRRITHRGLELQKRSKNWLDLYHGDDWSDDVGPPTDYYVDTDWENWYIRIFPLPRTEDTDVSLVTEYVKQHTTMDEATDEPFDNIPYLRPYHYGIAYAAASNLLTQDPDPINAAKAARYFKVSETAYSDLIQHFKAFEKDEPLRMSGGRNWVY